MTSDEKENRRAKVAAILQDTLGQEWRRRTALALDLEPSAVRRMFTPPEGRTDAPSTALEAVAEFLQATPRNQWPARWFRGTSEARRET